MKRILHEVDPFTGLETEWFGDGERLVERTSASDANTRAVLDVNKRLANEPEYAKRGIKNDMQHVASIPADVWLRWKAEGFDIFTASTEEVLKKLRNPDYAHLKVTSGRI